MEIVQQCFELVTPVNLDQILKHLEEAGRTSYQSYDRITDDSHKKFFKEIIRNKHEGLLEHYSVSLRITTDRAVANQIVRHRLASYVQESTRFCNYTKEKFGGLKFVRPFWIEPEEIEKIKNNEDVREEVRIWYNACAEAEKNYFRLIELGLKPQQARGVLPLSLKTELFMTTNLRNLKHMILMRTSESADPQTKMLFECIKDEFMWLF